MRETNPSPARYVREFHEAFGLPIARGPQWPAEPVPAQRLALLLEEVREVEKAVEESDLPGLAQELADVVYVAYGTALAFGVDLDAVLCEVHRANMSKLDQDGKPIVRDGKVIKSDRFRPPDVARVLREGE